MPVAAREQDLIARGRVRLPDVPTWALLVLTLTVFLVVQRLCTEMFVVPSASMEPTLQVGDRIVVDKLVYRLRRVDRGEIIVFDASRTGFAGAAAFSPEGGVAGALAGVREVVLGGSTEGGYVVKRVVGVPGDVVAVEGEALRVNGEVIEERYLAGGAGDGGSAAPTLVPQGAVYVLGDNRGGSGDSRFYGLVPISQIVGEAYAVVLPQPQLLGEEGAFRAQEGEGLRVPLLPGPTVAVVLMGYAWLRSRARR